MADKLIKFVLEGAPERQGGIPADVFVTKLRQFLTTFYSFDRAFSRKRKRLLNLDIVDLEKVNPSRIVFKPLSSSKSYDPNAVVAWTMGQLAGIHDKGFADEAVPQEALDNLVYLSRTKETKPLQLVRLFVQYSDISVNLDTAMEMNALTLRETRQIDTAALWEPGVSRGSLFGELRGVMDLNGEKQFYVRPPSGPGEVLCLFPESLRSQMQENLFHLVRVNGFLRYDGQKPTPYLVEAESIDKVSPPQKHFRYMYGAFRDLETPDSSELA